MISFVYPRRRPLPNRRLSRAQLVQAATAMQYQRDQALGQVTAVTQRTAARLEQAADELAASRSVVRREVAGELRQLAASIEGGPK